MRLVIVPENVQVWPSADCYLADEWHEIVWDSARILAYQTGFVRSDGIEIPEIHDGEVRISDASVGEDFLYVEFGSCVRICSSSSWRDFGKGKIVDGIRRLVDCCR